jgi:hypothetical protein
VFKPQYHKKDFKNKGEGKTKKEEWKDTGRTEKEEEE